jgi:hypothetical protein
MFATFRRLANTSFFASRQAQLSGFRLRQAQAFVYTFRAASLRFAPRGFNPSCIIAGHRLTWRSSGTGQKLRFCPAPELLR